MEKVDKPSAGLDILSFLIPLVGVVIYFCNREHKPIRAKSAGKWALIGFGASLLFQLLNH